MSEQEKTLICTSRRVYDNDLTGHCSVCLKEIFFRPHSQFITRKVCWVCGSKEMKESGQLIPEVTQDSRKELAELGIDWEEEIARMFS